MKTLKIRSRWVLALNLNDKHVLQVAFYSKLMGQARCVQNKKQVPFFILKKICLPANDVAATTLRVKTTE